MVKNEKTRNTCFRIADFLYPRACIGCNKAMNERSGFRHICTECEKSFWLHREPSCKFCGLTCPNIEEKQEWICANCRELEPFFDNGKSLFQMRGVGKKMIHVLKYQEGLFLKSDFLALLDKYFLAYKNFLTNSRLVPVPLHFWREYKRGYNQSVYLAHWLAEWSGSSVCFCLKRRHSTRTQTELNKDDRKKNVKNAFALSKKEPINAKERYVVVDDVFTTGATLNACAKALKEAGATRIGIFTFGHG